MQHNYGLIMAGGVGTRFWPVSKSSYPKQFHDILGTGRTFLQQTFDRINRFIPAEQIYVVTTEAYVELTLQQLPEIQPQQVIREPVGRNTAACNLYAAFKVHMQNPKANLLVAPSDHVILKEDAFAEKVKKALDWTEETGDLVTLGIQPTRPDTGYGYIQFDASDSSEVKPVKTFLEKPQLELAKEFVASGEFLWNAGIFVWSTQAILDAFAQHLPEMHAAVHEIREQLHTPAEDKIMNVVYPTLQNISVDNGIMEKAENVTVIPSDLGWSDLGTWGSLYANLDKDKNENLVQGKHIRLYDTTGCLVRCKNDKAVVIEGLENYIVVDTERALLICPLDKDQDVKKYVNELKINKKGDFI